MGDTRKHPLPEGLEDTSWRMIPRTPAYLAILYLARDVPDDEDKEFRISELLLAVEVRAAGGVSGVWGVAEIESAEEWEAAYAARTLRRYRAWLGSPHVPDPFK